jgi:hypothetical protein
VTKRHGFLSLELDLDDIFCVYSFSFNSFRL